MRYRDFLKSTITSLALLAVFSPSAAFSSDASKRWAEGVTKPPIELQRTPDGALDANAEVQRISKYVQELKADVIELNNDLRLMEEELLFPSSTKHSVFISLSSGQFFTLESVKLRLNGKLVATHVYSESQRQAMLRGGVQRMYVTNLNEGKHTATALFTGIGPNGREYKRATHIEFEKSAVGKYLEVAIGDDPVKQEPVFAIKQW